MREVASDPITVEQGCQWRKGCVKKSEDGPIMNQSDTKPQI